MDNFCPADKSFEQSGPGEHSDVSLGYQFCKNITFILYILYNVRYNNNYHLYDSIPQVYNYCVYFTDNMEKKIHHLEKEMYQLKRNNIELTKENKNILQMVSACEERLMYNDDETTVLYENEKQQSKSDNTYDDDVRPYIDGTEDRSSLNTDTTEEVSHNADNDTRDKHSKRLLLSCMLSINIIYS